MEGLVGRFDRNKSGRIEFDNGEFLLVVALMDVVGDIDDFALVIGFKTFDQDGDGAITTSELEAVARIFLPMKVQQTDDIVNKLMKEMNFNMDGKVSFQEFETFLKNAKSEMN